MEIFLIILILIFLDHFSIMPKYDFSYISLILALHSYRNIYHHDVLSIMISNIAVSLKTDILHDHKSDQKWL